MAELAVQKAPLDFGIGLSDAVDEVAGGNPQIANILKDAAGFIRLAPGTSSWSWFPSTSITVEAASQVALVGKGWHKFTITGPGSVSFIRTTDWASGDIVTLVLPGATTLAHNASSAPSGYAPLQLATGAAVTGPGTFHFKYDGTDWDQVADAAEREVIGITEFKGAVVYVTKDRRLWAISAPGLISPLSNGTATTKLDGNQPPVFAATKSTLLVAGGGLMQSWTGSGLSSRVSNGPRASHVVANAQRAVANAFDASGQFSWTEPSGTDHTSSTAWDALNFAEAEARPDAVYAIHENSDEVFLFGARTVQIFAPDANVGYAPQYTLNQGCVRYSIINLLEKRAFAWLTEDREFVISSVRDDPTPISRPDITRTIKNLPHVDDCTGFYWKVDNYRLLVWRFPSAGVAFAYDIDAKRWFRLLGYDTTLGDYAAYPIVSSFFWPEQNVFLVGLSTGEIAKLDMDAVSVAGQPIIGRARLGFQGRGTEGPKQTLTLRVPLKRGLGSLGATNPPFIELRWADRPGAWSKPLQLSLGAAEQNRPELVKRIVSRPYVRRQWELTIGAGVGALVGPFEETFELLED